MAECHSQEVREYGDMEWFIVGFGFSWDLLNEKTIE